MPNIMNMLQRYFTHFSLINSSQMNLWDILLSAGAVLDILCKVQFLNWMKQEFTRVFRSMIYSQSFVTWKDVDDSSCDAVQISEWTRVKTSPCHCPTSMQPSSRKWSSGAHTTRTIRQRQRTTRIKRSEPTTSAHGMWNSSRSTRARSSNSFWWVIFGPFCFHLISAAMLIASQQRKVSRYCHLTATCDIWVRHSYLFRSLDPTESLH